MASPPARLLVDRIAAALQAYGKVGLAFLFGSMARGEAREDSDLDIAVAGTDPLSAADRLELMDRLAVLAGRPVDLVDLRTAPPPLLRHALTTGVLCLRTDSTLHAEMLRRLWYEQADIMPNYSLILRRRREMTLSG